MEADMDTATATILIALHDAGLSPQNAAARNQFVQQTSLVVRGIRAGYLVDAFPFPQRKLDSWSRALTARLPNTDKDFAILHEDSSDSLFFVNRILLLDNLKSGSVPIWVNTDNSSIQLDTPPPLLALLDHLITLLQDQSTSIQTFTVHHPSLLVPLAAFLLEYPVGYIIPETFPDAFLPNVILNVFQCTLLRPDRSREPLISFSCPAALTLADDLTNRVKRRFEPRLHSDSTYGSLDIDTSVQVFDRVAL